MKALYPVLWRLGFILFVVTGLTYLAFGLPAVWIASTIILGIWVLLQLRYLARLLNWLQDPKENLEGRGIWDVIFAALLEQRKKSSKRKQEIINTLERFNRVAEAVPTGIIILDHRGRIEWFNQLAVKHLNLDPKNDKKAILQNIIRLPDFQRFLQKKRQNEPLVIKIQLPNGNYLPRTLLIQRFPFEIYNELLVTIDITEKEQIDNNQIAFVANASHELRTPLTVVHGFLETLADNPELPQEQRSQFINLMRHESQRMLNVLSDLLLLSRLEKGGQQAFERFDLSQLVHQVVQEGRNLSKDQHLFNVIIDEDLYFNGILTEMHSALNNLVFNAVRYTPEGGEIIIQLTKLDDSFVKFSVKDTGVGIPAEHIPRLTERFYRVDNSRSRQSGGTGLGLAIVKFALAKYNVQLQIYSEVGKGSEFVMVLPLN